jgi:lipopolysaccharide/colanic/teichoic acid biosynthesis glycosyltransferase
MGQTAKRCFDVCLAGLGLILSVPLWAVFALAVKLEDGGPVFYGNVRVGRFGRRFISWKFRSMIVDANPYLQAQHYDSRVTKVGRFLRATAMDELPQLWNILVGQMSFVGPRPLMPDEIERYSDGEVVPLEKIPGYRQRHQVRPGLTGLAQIYAPRDIPRRQKFRYDRIYIKNQKFCLDSKLLILSFWITLRARWEESGDKLARGQKAEVRGRRSEIRDQKLAVGGQIRGHLTSDV